ncbi:MAG: DUF4177 domain-containing protein [Candidatus Bathyarchaeota archaeon]|nr:DUF4177 domain-containing protein [Candidatus Bathyarchaeota archaeon]
MYEYKFHRIKLEPSLLRSKKPYTDYQEIVREHARQGWRLVQIFSPTVSVLDGGTSEYFELIFEKETS